MMISFTYSYCLVFINKSRYLIAMQRLFLFFLCLILALRTGSCQSDEDLIDISNITVFPQDYQHNLRAGYLNITPYEQAYYYIFCERYNEALS